MVESASVRSQREFEDPQLEYQSVDGWAVGGLILGLLSPAAALAPLLWLVPPIGILVDLVALVRLRADATRIGRKAALVGFALSVFFGMLPLGRTIGTYLLLANQPRPMAEQFIEYMRTGHPEKALMLRHPPDLRQPLDDDARLWTFYQHDKESKAELIKFANYPLGRALLALGDRAEVNYWYTVTFEDADHQKKTFFLSILLERRPGAKSDNPWRVKDFFGGFDPAGS